MCLHSVGHHVTLSFVCFSLECFGAVGETGYARHRNAVFFHEDNDETSRHSYSYPMDVGIIGLNELKSSPRRWVPGVMLWHKSLSCLDIGQAGSIMHQMQSKW
jgi:hypothetical protein